MDTLNTTRKMLVVVVAGLGHALLEQHRRLTAGRLQFTPMTTVFPALTCPVQATLRTALPPAGHGSVANGWFSRELARAWFWEQSAAQVDGPRIWDSYRRAGRRVAMLFWQQSLGETVDIVLSPAPIHRHHGGMIQSCYSRPADLYERLRHAVGRPFDLMHYWGPLASVRSSQWIADATAALLADPADAPDLCLTYLPGLDYNLQRHGPRHRSVRRDLRCVLRQVEQLDQAAQAHGYDTLVLGDYAIAHAGAPLYPNRVLRDAGLFDVRIIQQMEYADLYASPAYALVDHEITHIYTRDADTRRRVCELFAGVRGVARVLQGDALRDAGLAHARAGDVVLVADDGYWFSYRYWQPGCAPEYAGHVDIHQKPGFDPCELFFGWPPGQVSQDDRRVHGSHGQAGPDRAVAYAASWELPPPPDLLALAGQLRDWLSQPPA